MCGIAGIIRKQGEVVQEYEIEGLTDPIAHRGPDGKGYYVAKNVAFGHRRLAIIDLSDSGNQPMHSGGLTITYNGEIYNYLELRDELERHGILFKTKTDTEVILKAYEYWGKDCLSRFNGMWAFAIHDRENSEVFLSRDRFGIKPLYYYCDEHQFVFGSEIKQLLGCLKERKVNREALYDFLYLSLVSHNNATFFQNIFSLEPGNSMLVNARDLQIKTDRYYELKEKTGFQNETLEDAVNRYKNAFAQSIKFRLRSDVKVGTCLSGGLDSSYIAIEAAKKYKGEDAFTAVTAKSIDPSNDESRYAELVVKHSQLNWELVEPTENDFKENIANLMYIQEEPFPTPSIFMQYFVMQEARKKGCVVMLDGQGGDETLLGYERYFIPYLKNISSPVKFATEFLALARNSKLSFGKLLLYYFYFGYNTIKEIQVKRRTKYLKNESLKYLNKQSLSAFTKSASSMFSLQKSEITTLQLPKLLKFEDKNSMAHSLEARVPFLDHEVVEVALSINSNHKIHKGWSKFILRKAYCQNAPAEIAWRKEKFGFEAPSSIWLRNKTVFVDTIRNSEFMNHFIKKDYDFGSLNSEDLWKLYSVAKWSEIFKVTY